MSESDLYPDHPGPVEDRVRRTLAVRAEDMAPGDGPSDQGVQAVLTRSTGGGTNGRQGRRSGRVLLAAAIVVVLGAGLAAVGIVIANDDGTDEAGDLATSDGEAEEEGAAAVSVDLAAQRNLVTALQDERNLASVDLLGQADTVALAVDDPAEARRRTDAAIAAVRTVVDAGPAGSPYQQALDALVEFDALRSDIDAYDGPRSLEGIDLVNEMFARYADMIGGLLDAQRDLALAIDDPELRAGIEVHQLGMRQQELTAQLARATLLNAIAPTNSASLIEVSSLHELVRQGQEDLTAAAAGTPYEGATATVVGEIEASGLLDIVATALDGTTNIADLLAAVELPVDEGWPAFLDRVEQMLAEEG